jgi:NhaC family Na+:H+ antiporter
VSLIIAFAFYFLVGRPGDFDASAEIDAMRGAFHVSLWLFAPLVLVILLAVFKIPPFTAIFLGALAGGVLAVCVAPERVIALASASAGAKAALPDWLALAKGVWLALASGYTASTGNHTLDVLVSRGGMESMLNTIWLIISALAFGGVVEKCGVLERVIRPVIEKAKGAGALVASLVAAVVATNIVTADQYIAIVLPARMFKTAFARRGFAPVVLSRAVGDSATPTGALIPWNSCGAYMAATLGVATLSYAPYAVFCFVSPLLTVAMAYAGIRMPRMASDMIEPASAAAQAGATRSDDDSTN